MSTSTVVRDLNHCAVCGTNVTTAVGVLIHVATAWPSPMVAVTCGPTHAERFTLTHPDTTPRTEV